MNITVVWGVAEASNKYGNRGESGNIMHCEGGRNTRACTRTDASMPALCSLVLLLLLAIHEVEVGQPGGEQRNQKQRRVRRIEHKSDGMTMRNPLYPELR